jgi:peptide/nickel transport system substrate-binding protein
MGDIRQTDMTFHLRKGVQWHWGNGEVTSEDIVFSLNRVRNSKASAFRGTYENFKEIKAMDKYTVQITTAKPEPFLLTKVANYYGGYIVCKKALEKAGTQDRGVAPKKEEVIGTGPFKFVEYKPKDRILLVRNDEYWKGKPIMRVFDILLMMELGTCNAEGRSSHLQWVTRPG